MYEWDQHRAILTNSEGCSEQWSCGPCGFSEASLGDPDHKSRQWWSAFCCRKSQSEQHAPIHRPNLSLSSKFGGDRANWTPKDTRPFIWTLTGMGPFELQKILSLSSWLTQKQHYVLIAWIRAPRSFVVQYPIIRMTFERPLLLAPYIKYIKFYLIKESPDLQQQSVKGLYITI